MSQAARGLSGVHDAEVQLEPFLQELTQLSRKYKIGITGDPVLFCLEDEEIDLNITYSSDADSNLVY